MMNPEHPSNDDDVIELTDEVPIELTPADEVLEPIRAEKPVFPGNMGQPIEVSTLPPEPFEIIHSQETRNSASESMSDSTKDSSKWEERHKRYGG